VKELLDIYGRRSGMFFIYGWSIRVGCGLKVKEIFSWVVADTAVVHPIAPIAVYVVVKQHAFAIGGTDAPVLLQFLGLYF